MNKLIEGLVRFRKSVSLRWQLAGLSREKNRMIFILGHKTLSLSQHGEINHRNLLEECQGIETIEQEIETTQQELAGLRVGISGLTCRSCGEKIDRVCLFCPQCGEKNQEATHCPHCLTNSPGSYRFCPECGTPKAGDEGAE